MALRDKMDKKFIKGLNPNSLKVKLYKSTLTNLSDEQKEASIGLILGDASLQTQNKGKTYRIKFEWGDKNKAYTDHVFKLYDEWVLSEPHKKARTSPNNNLIVNWGFQTISHDAFNFLAELFLSNKNKKSIPNNLVLEHLTPRGLAYWFMDDGGKLDYNKGSKNKSIVLNTHSFTSVEVHQLSIELATKFKLDCSTRLNKGKEVIVISSSSFDEFYELVNPYLLEEMKYKLPHFN